MRATERPLPNLETANRQAVEPAARPQAILATRMFCFPLTDPDPERDRAQPTGSATRKLYRVSVLPGQRGRLASTCSIRRKRNRDVFFSACVATQPPLPCRRTTINMRNGVPGTVAKAGRRRG